VINRAQTIKFTLAVYFPAYPGDSAPAVWPQNSPGSAVGVREIFGDRRVFVSASRARARAHRLKKYYLSDRKRPAVISVNMLGSALAVDELLARLHPFREEANSNFASVIFSLASMELIIEPEEGRCALLADNVGMGDTAPLLGLIELAEGRTA
jgi:hypothetical protein